MPSAPDPDTRLTVSEPDQSEMDPILTSGETHPECEVVPNPSASDPVSQLDATASDDVLSLFPDEPGESSGFISELETPFEEVPRAPSSSNLASEGQIVLKQLVSRTGMLKRGLDELEYSAAQLLGEQQKIERELREAAASLAKELSDNSERASGECRRIEDTSRDVIAKLAADCSRAEDLAREAEKRSATTFETLQRIERNIVELRVLESIAKAEDRLAVLDARADQLDERLARKARERAATIDSLLAFALAFVTAVVTVLSGVRALANRWWTTLAAWTNRTSSSVNDAQRPSLARRRAIVVGLGVLALVIFIVSRSLGTTDRQGTKVVEPRESDLLLARARDLPVIPLPSAAARLVDQPTAKPIVISQSKGGTVAPSKAGAPAVAVTTLGSAIGSAKATGRDARPKAQAAAVPAQFLGTLAVESNPSGAAVFINRQRVGVTPLEVQGLQSGSRVIWIERAGYVRWTAAVDVSADKLTRVNAKLQADQTP